LTIFQTPHDSFETTFQPIKEISNVPEGGFSVNCNGRIIVGGTHSFESENWRSSRNIFVFESNNFTEIQSLNFRRSCNPAVYYSNTAQNHENVLIVTDGYESVGIMEYLIMSDSFRTNQWNVCSDRLPFEPSSTNHFNHRLTIFQNKLILTGVTGGDTHWKSLSNEVWMGTLSFKPELRVNWTSFPSMHESRAGHVAVVLDHKLFCIGGYNTKSTEYYSNITGSWQTGPYLPFTLYDANCIVNHTSTQCILFGGYRDGRRNCHSEISVFDPYSGLSNVQVDPAIGIHYILTFL
jgi:hypothetical protein